MINGKFCIQAIQWDPAPRHVQLEKKCNSTFDHLFENGNGWWCLVAGAILIIHTFSLRRNDNYLEKEVDTKMMFLRPSSSVETGSERFPLINLKKMEQGAHEEHVSYSHYYCSAHYNTLLQNTIGNSGCRTQHPGVYIVAFTCCIFWCNQ